MNCNRGSSCAQEAKLKKAHIADLPSLPFALCGGQIVRAIPRENARACSAKKRGPQERGRRRRVGRRSTPLCHKILQSQVDALALFLAQEDDEKGAAIFKVDLDTGGDIGCDIRKSNERRSRYIAEQECSIAEVHELVVGPETPSVAVEGAHGGAHHRRARCGPSSSTELPGTKNSRFGASLASTTSPSSFSTRPSRMYK